MAPALVLGAYALVVATFGAHLLRRSRWPERSPRLGILAWQALGGSVLASVVLGGLSLALPVWTHDLRLARLLDTCVALLREQYAAPGGATVASAGLAIAALATGRVAYSFGRATWVAATGRSVQRSRLALLARRDPERDVLVLEHNACAAYCVPGRGGRVVVTTATLEVLDDAQLAAVLRHERAHLRGRHHLVVQVASALRTAFPFVPAFAWGEVEIERLTEMMADDAAVRDADGLTLATALVRLAGGTAPAGALGAGGQTALARVRRLAAPVPPLGKVRTLATLVGVSAVALVPLALTVGPALAAMSANYCPITFPV